MLYRAQIAANIACHDVQGYANNRLHGWNYFWVVLGGFNWLLVLAGLYDTLVGFDLPA